ncbi:conserved hypothetical protein [Roseovarius sp. EC-HK134]|jgi:transcription elongation GreA/GreB family factor|uniref:hypothetical protein n=1 Tax=unclassified Roseovarius TaxID=2614913 RepID=UPI0012557E12|nr:MULTISPECIES: hypothetical protein [unclassified Roseovarius]VVS98009.1 conserved hypothetical protein [Roseovarius sp. EC-SD190]VVS99478.1 conserved hypothetical protein [Roseovarius sp. EC-HK134]
MFDVNQPDPSDIQTQYPLRMLRNTPATMPTADYQKLQEHLEDCECASRAGTRLLAYVLANKLMNTRPADDVHYTDLVIGGSCVTYVIDGTAPQTRLLVHRARTGQPSGVIPVASLLGATLIGMRTGQRAPLLLEDGSIGRLFVKDVRSSI